MPKPKHMNLRSDYEYTAPDGGVITIAMDAKRAEQMILYGLGDDAQRTKVAQAFASGFDELIDIPELEEHKASPQRLLDDVAAKLKAGDEALLSVLKEYKGDISEIAQKFAFPEEEAGISGRTQNRKYASGVALQKRKALDIQFERTIQLSNGKSVVDAPINGYIIRTALRMIDASETRKTRNIGQMMQSCQTDIYLYLKEDQQVFGDSSIATKIEQTGLELGEYASKILQEAAKEESGQLSALAAELNQYVDDNIDTTHVGRDLNKFIFGKSTAGKKGGGSRR